MKRKKNITKSFAIPIQSPEEELSPEEIQQQEVIFNQCADKILLNLGSIFKEIDDIKQYFTQGALISFLTDTVLDMCCAGLRINEDIVARGALISCINSRLKDYDLKVHDITNNKFNNDFLIPEPPEGSLLQ